MRSKTPLPHRFTVRVYGLWLRNNQILLSRENIQGQLYTKFPGGGLEFGEGTRECLAREFEEEAGVSIQTGDHFYTTERYIPSAFDPSAQVLSIYYYVAPDSPAQAVPTDNPQNSTLLQDPGDQVLFWQNLAQLHADMLPLPIDKKVVKLLLKSYR